MFITFEGPEGGGKSSQIAALAAYLRHNGYDVVATREPGGTAIGDQIRACVHDVGNTAMTAVSEFLLYSASRAQLVREVIEPALAQDKVVLCDRYADSTLAYQGYGRQLDMAVLKQVTYLATGGRQPELTLLLDIPVVRGLARRTDNKEEMNRLDREALAFHERVRAGYHDLIAQEPERWCVVNADRPFEPIQADVRQIVVARLTA